MGLSIRLCPQTVLDTSSESANAQSTRTEPPPQKEAREIRPVPMLWQVPMAALAELFRKGKRWKKIMNLIVSTSIKYQQSTLSNQCIPMLSVICGCLRITLLKTPLHISCCLEETMGCGMLETFSLNWKAHSQTEASLYLEVDFKPRRAGQTNTKSDIVGCLGAVRTNFNRNALSWITLVRVVNLLRNWA